MQTNQINQMPAYPTHQYQNGMMPAFQTQGVPVVVEEPVKDSRLENAKKLFEKLAKDYAVGQISSVKKTTVVKDGDVKSTFTPSSVTRSNTAKRFLDKADTVRDVSGNLVQAIGLERKATITSLNISGSVENVGCYLASRFKKDPSRFSELCAMTGWTSLIDTLANNQVTSVQPENIGHSRQIRILPEFDSYYELIKSRSDILAKTDVRNTDEGKTQIKNISTEMDRIAAQASIRLLQVTDIISDAASRVICQLFKQQYSNASDEAIKDWINSDPNIYMQVCGQIKSNKDLIPYVSRSYRIEDQVGYLFTSTIDLFQWLAMKYDEIQVSVDAQISMLEIVQLAQKHGLITDVYAAFPSSLREERVDPATGAKYTAYPKFEIVNGYNKYPLILTSNAYKLGFVVPINYTATDLLEDDDTPKEKGVRTKKTLTPAEAIAHLKASIIGKLEKVEDNDKILKNLGVIKGQASFQDSLMRRERVYVIGKTWNPSQGTGLTAQIKNSNHQFVWPQAPFFEIKNSLSRTSDNKLTISDNKLVFASIARSLAFSKESKDLDKTQLPVLIKGLTSLFFGDNVPQEYSNPVTGGAAIYAASSMIGFSSPVAYSSQNSVFTQQAPTMPTMPVASYSAPVNNDSI